MRNRHIGRDATHCERSSAEASNTDGLGKHERVGEAIGTLTDLQDHSNCHLGLEIPSLSFRPIENYRMNFYDFQHEPYSSTKPLAFR